MGLAKLVNTYFNPKEGTKQLQDNSLESNTIGVLGFGLLATAAIGYQFLGARGKTAAMMAGAGASFLASYYTEKSGYAWLVGLAGACGMAYATVDAVNSGRLWVTVNFDIAEIIRAVRENHPQRH